MLHHLTIFGFFSTEDSVNRRVTNRRLYVAVVFTRYRISLEFTEDAKSKCPHRTYMIALKL